MTISKLRLAFTAFCAFFGAAIFAQNSSPTLNLFSNTLRTEDKSFQSEQLAPAEKRMRIVRLEPFLGNTPIDLSRKLTLRLFDDVEYTVQLTREEGWFFDDVEVWKGRVADPRFAHLGHYLNTVFVVNPKTHKLVANIETDKGFFQILPTAQADVYRIRDCKPFDGSTCGEVPMKQHETTRGLLELRGDCGNACFNETDANGKYVIDVFAGYSTGAATTAGDLSAHAQANLQTAITGLSNSLVTTCRLRLVGTGTTTNNPGIVTSVLDDAWTWFAASIETTAPDMLMVFQTPTGASGEAGGWGQVPGRVSVNGVAYPTVYRHEVGHNVGGSHCYPNNSTYKNGHNNGSTTTHLCGNGTNFYSNPNVNDASNNPIGNATTADMARAWGEQAPIMAKLCLASGGVCCGRCLCESSLYSEPLGRTSGFDSARGF